MFFEKESVLAIPSSPMSDCSLCSATARIPQNLKPTKDAPLMLDDGSLSDWAPLLLEPSSPLGLLLRRLALAFEQLPFEEVARVCAALQVRGD